MKKGIAILLAALLAMSTLVACGSTPANTDTKAEETKAEDTKAEDTKAEDTKAEETAAPSGDAKEVVFAAWTKEENVIPLTENFNKDFEGKYTFSYYKLADAATLTINTALQSGDKIDVMTQASMTDLRQRADDGVYLGLKQFFDAEGTTYAEVFGDSIEETENINGDYYAVPYNKNVNMVWFNKKMFDEAGVEYPQEGWTWADFEETCKALTSGEGADKVYGAMIDFGNSDFYWDLIARQELGANVYFNEDQTASKLDDPMFKTSLDYFYNLANVEKVIVPLDEYTALQYQDDPTAMAGLYNGKYAMWIAPVYGCLYLNPSYGEVPEGTDLGLADMPTLNGGEPKTTIYTSTASIPATVEDPQAAWELIKYVCIDRADLFAGPKAMHPGASFKSKEDADKFNDMIFNGKPGLDYDMAMEVMARDRIEVTKDCGFAASSDVNDVAKEEITMLFSDEQTVDEALANMKARMDEVIANY